MRAELTERVRHAAVPQHPRKGPAAADHENGHAHCRHALLGEFQQLRRRVAAPHAQ